MEIGWWPAAAFYSHPGMHIAPLHIVYHTTVLYETELWAFDEFRKYVPRAQNCCVDDTGQFRYSYYLLNSIEGKLLTIFTNGSNNIESREPNYHQLLIFRNEEEKADFDLYLKKHFNDYTDAQIKEQYKYQIQEDKPENGGGLIYSAYQVAKAAMIYKDWYQVHTDNT